MITPVLNDWMRPLGAGCVLVSIVMFTVAVVVFAGGFEPAFLAMPLALGIFTVGIGALSVGRR